MIGLPLSVLALAAGVYLLIKVNREYLGGIFKFFAWLIILLSLVSIVAIGRHAIHHCCHGGMGRMHGNCDMHERVMIKEFRHCDMDADSGACPMAGCKMVGDSVILDRAVCEKMMGKEACDNLCKGQAQCTISKEQCAKMCSGMSKCSAGQPACCKEGDKACCKGEEKEMKSCCKGEQTETKACCKKK